MHQRKALGKLGNIFVETLCFLPMFPCFPTCGNIVAEAKLNLLPRKQKCFLRNSETFFGETMFPSLPTCFEMFSARETLFSRLGKFKKYFKTIVQM